MIPRVSGTANNTRVQDFILDYFSKLNTTSLTGGDTPDSQHNNPIKPRTNDPKAKTKKHQKDQERISRLFRRAPGTPGTGWHVEIDRFTETTPFGPKTFTNLVFTKNPQAENRLVHLAEQWAQRVVPRTRTATGRSGGSSSNNLDGIELFVLLDLLGVESPTVPNYFSATHWAHRHTMSIEQRLWEAKLHGGQVLARKKEKLQEGAGEDEDDMDDLGAEEPVQGFLTANPPYGGIEDDHRPFLQRGVPIFHVIPTPFPSVWHRLEDNADVISPEVVEGWANIFRAFAVEYLQLLEPQERRRDEL
ncbi:hypothetical protein BGZ54_005934 [Gamsiella multidivaricata]|nr:hypothetical protein BGZ54_005934 [Gamsiella multidivaricata]